MSRIISLAEYKKFNWIVYAKEISSPCIVRACNPWEAMNRVVELHPYVMTFTTVTPEDDDMEWLSEWDTPAEGWGVKA